MWSKYLLYKTVHLIAGSLLNGTCIMVHRKDSYHPPYLMHFHAQGVVNATCPLRADLSIPGNTPSIPSSVTLEFNMAEVLPLPRHDVMSKSL